MITYNPAFAGRSLLTLGELTDDEMLELIQLAIKLKARRASGLRGDLLHRRNIALIFEKNSTRTRSAATIAARDEGGNVEYMNRNDIHIGVKESVKDSARVLGRMFDGILYRGFAQRTVEQLAKFSGVPVWNGLTDYAHPTQVLADLMTVQEAFGSLRGKKLVYIGDGRNNVANSLMLGCAKAGLHYVNCTPSTLLPDPELVRVAQEIGRRTGGSVQVNHDPVEAVAGANVLYTDVWVSMGEESQSESRMNLLRPYQVNMELVRHTGNLGGELIFLHCLPAFHDHETDYSSETGALEVTDEVFEAPFSKVFDEAENRMHTIKALFVSALAER
jgi:ornithine carbamoyltransferase